jgi:membrane protein implicated in regulation of membrane protease activity
VLPLLKYTVLRLALFIGALWLLTLLGASALVALVGAAVMSFLLSYLLLRGAREQLAEQIANQVQRRHTQGRSTVDPDAEIEDAVADRIAADQVAGEQGGGRSDD